MLYKISCSAHSLKNLELIWIEDLKANLKDATIILVGNKKDFDSEMSTKFKR